jgi:hypothetical protein
MQAPRSPGLGEPRYHLLLLLTAESVRRRVEDADLRKSISMSSRWHPETCAAAAQSAHPNYTLRTVRHCRYTEATLRLLFVYGPKLFCR